MFPPALRNKVGRLLTPSVLYVPAQGLDPQAGPVRQEAIPYSVSKTGPLLQGSYPPDYHTLEGIAQEVVPTLAPGISLGPSALTSCGSSVLL